MHNCKSKKQHNIPEVPVVLVVQVLPKRNVNVIKTYWGDNEIKPCYVTYLYPFSSWWRKSWFTFDSFVTSRTLIRGYIKTNIIIEQQQ